MARLERTLLREIINARYDAPIPKYLDLACGTGRITELVAPFSTTSVAIDVSEKMVTEARAKCPATRFYVGDYLDQRLDLGPMDLMTSFRFFGNAEPELRNRAFKFVANNLAEDGLFVMNNHRNPHSIQNLLYRSTGGENVMDLSPSRLVQNIEEVGLKIRKAFPIGTWLVRHSLHRRAVLESRYAEYFEKLFSRRVFWRIAPDVILLIQKAR